MKQKDYKGVANILRIYKGWDTTYNEKSHSDICNLFANYFERENNTEMSRFSQMDANCPSPFNRKQFLKDCGVKE